MDELSNQISVQLPARVLNALTRLGFVVEIHEVEEGIPAKTVDNHACTDDHSFTRWESWWDLDQLKWVNKSATRSLSTPMSAINIATLHNKPNFYNGSGVVIGIIDSGIQRTHECFDIVNNPTTKTSDNNKIRAEKEFTNGLGANDDGNANTADDETGHGTQCAGVAAGYDKNNTEYVGTAPDAKLAIAKMAYKDATGQHWPSDMFINALKWLVNDLQFPTVDVISCSVCYWEDNEGNDISPNGLYTITRWIDWAVKQGRVVRTAMGNDFDGNPPEKSPWSPADNYNGISVGATKNDGSAITYYSRRGRWYV